MFEMFIHYQKKDKRKFLILKSLVFIGIILMALLSLRVSNLKLPTLEDKLSFGIGMIIIVLVVVLAFLNRIKAIFKIKSLGFLLTFIVLLLFSKIIDTLVVGVGLISIPLLLDDLVINNYFKYINITKYWNIYKDVMVVESRWIQRSRRV